MIAGVTQPYLFPHIGYFQLIQSVDRFVLYDDVSFIKRGWINRNKILVNSKSYMFTIPCKGASQNIKINKVELFDESHKALNKLVSTIKHSYSKAPQYEVVLSLIESIISIETNSIVELIQRSLTSILEYLDINKIILRSSEQFTHLTQLDRSDRLIQICKELKADQYINTPGGKDLYNKAYFNSKGIKLSFIESNKIRYKQYNNPFVPDLSIIDILMFNDKEKVKEMFKNYQLS